MTTATKTKTRKSTSKKDSTEKFDLYQHVTDKIIAMLEQGHIPWSKPWTGSSRDNNISNFSLPRNYATNKPYRGINVLLLMSSGHKSRYFMTFKQVQDIGGKIKKGSKSEIVTYWKFLEVDLKVNNVLVKDKNGKQVKKSIPLLKYYRVFSLDDIEGFKPIKNREETKPIEPVKPINDTNQFEKISSCEAVFDSLEDMPEVQHADNSAYYVPSKDYINMPIPENFIDNHSYYATLFHELSHATGHESRLNRDKKYSTRDGKAFEELIAELSSCFLCAETGIINDSLQQNTVAYVQSWIQVFKNDNKILLKASSQAQKSADYILNKTA